MTRAAIFLDKDGTLVDDIPYNVDPALVRLAPGAAEGTAALHDAGYLLVVVSNQSGVARGYFDEKSLGPVGNRLEELLGAAGAKLAGFYYCPHHPEGIVPAYSVGCQCRKPRPGMLLAAADDLGIDLSSSWLIGDILDDIEAGRTAGCRTVLIKNGNETEWDLGQRRVPDRLAANFTEAVDWILK